MDNNRIDNSTDKTSEIIKTPSTNKDIIDKINELIQAYNNINNSDKINKLINLIVSYFNISDKTNDNNENTIYPILQGLFKESDRLKINQQNINADKSTITITNINQPTLNITQTTNTTPSSLQSTDQTPASKNL